MNEPIFIDRPPRIQPDLPSGEFDIPKPPQFHDEGQARLIQVGLPLITIIGYVFVSVVAGGNSLGLLIPMALSVVAAVAFSIYSLRKERQQREELERAYAHRLVELNTEMHTAHDLQRRFYRYNYPDQALTLQFAQQARREAERKERTLRSEARLWERRTSDADFGAVRLGVGTLPSTVVYKLSDLDDYATPPLRAARKIDTDSRFVDDIPVIIGLRQPPKDEGAEDGEHDDEVEITTPIVHALGIAGERSAVYSFARALIAHYAVFHAPADARLYLLASERREWSWAEMLPHARGDDQNRSCCFVHEIRERPDERAFDDDEGGELEQYLEGIRKILAQRKIRLEEREGQDVSDDATLPFLLVVVDLLDATYTPTSPLQGIETDAALAILLEEGQMLGASVVFLVPERSKVPGSCGAVIEIERTTPATSSRIEQNEKLHFRYTEVGVNRPHYVGEADAIPSVEAITQLATDLAAVHIRQGSGATLAGAVPFFELMGYSSLTELTTHATSNWQASAQSRYANWMRVKIGMMAGNKPRTLVFSAKRDGVHGMVAGSTGSGKSELLISLLAGMAVTYDPSVLNFVLVDYKGGGAFKEFIDLPHCVDIITNLAADGVTRMFTAITAEMRRRQALNAETGTKNIVEYRQKGLHLTNQPYPFLFIVIDEFAEMIADRAEYKTELESITRVGRAQGVSLILAAQRPSGVTDQMRSNIKFRICLRVETPGESREMLRRADATYLPPGVPGRGYLQVGNEEIELIQVAYTGDLYIDPQQAPTAAVIWPERGGRVALAQDVTPPELYKAIITALEKLAKDQGRPQQRAPWPNFLPRQLALAEPLISDDVNVGAVTSEEYVVDIDHITLGAAPEPTLTLNPSINRWLEGGVGWIEPLDWTRYALRPVVGLVDNPYAAQQLPLVIDLPRGHVVVFGASGTGKTTFIRTLIASLAATHSPDAFHAYLLDLGGRNLGALASLPHVGAVVTPDEEGYEERVAQVLREISEIVERRTTLLSTAAASDLYDYNQHHPDALLPAIVVAIDNFTEFTEAFGGQGGDVETVLERFIALARQSKPYGIHFIVSLTQLGSLSNQLYSLFSERYTLRLVDPTEYRAVVGGSVTEIGDVPGRGYARIGRQPLAFQVAQPFELRRSGQDANEVRELEQFAQIMNQYLATSGRSYNLPIRVDALPTAVLFKKLLADQYRLPLDATFLPRLREVTRKQWQASTEAAEADWLQVLIGVASGNRARTLHLEAKRDGVHGMIAGGTGAGKSELLMSLIVGLALNYDPSILNFVLVDYKGGGAFAPFAKLPHCVDSITNLNKAAVKRMFTAINAEMRRRQALNATTGTKDIVEYRQKGLHRTHAPYPHLFIIIDEYAEMITTNPEFGAELDSITRVGRAQGVNLLLASQRPTGVSDQMRANIKLRICLRVEGVDTSREMLRRPDAAYLPNGMPGRGYLQVGNEQVELVQMAYTGETYQYAEANESGEKPKFYDVIVQMTNDLLTTQRPRTPWPPFLPNAQTFSDPLRERYLDRAAQPLVTLGRSQWLALNPFVQDWLDGRGVWPGMNWDRTAMRAIVGLVDDPYNSRQLPLIIDFSKGHAVVFGASGWGKTTLLRALVLSLAATHAPDEFQAHILDLGGRNLEVLETLPHVGTVIMPDERGYEERVQQLWRELNEVVDTRKRLFSTAGVSTLYEYNAGQPEPKLPAVLIIIDNFSEFIETFGSGNQADDENSLLAMFVTLARQGRAYGLHVIITANRLNVLTSKLYSLFTERYALRLADAEDYSSIVGTNVPEAEEIPGRGYTRIERNALTFQVALPPGVVDASGQVRGEARQIRTVGQHMQAFLTQAGRTYRRPFKIAALPKSSSYRDVLSEVFQISKEPGLFLDALTTQTAATWGHNGTAEHADWLKVPLGITSGNRTRTLNLEAKQDGVHGMVAGGTGSGKSELLMTLIVGLALHYSPDILNFVLVDYKGGGAFTPFAQLPHCVDIVTNLNTAAVERMFTAINAEIRRRQALNAATGTKDIVEYRKRGLHLKGERYPHLFIIIDEYAEMISANDAYLRELDSITRVGRAQGINLLLASQQPKGVTDQMRANIKLRLCLRVEQMDTSRELLRRPDAALLPNGMPGRGYMQVGNEHLELIQVSYTGESQPDDRAAPVLWPDRVHRGLQNDEETPKLYDMVVRITAELAGQRASRLWPAFLPERFSLEMPRTNTTTALLPAVSDWLNGDTRTLWPGVDWRETALRPIVGLVDDPAEARQDALRFDLSRSHLAVFGDSGMGKSTLLRSLLVSLAATHSPDELHIYVLDLGGRTFRSVEELPHVGAVIYGDEETFEERLQRLLELLNRTADARQQILSAADSTNLYEYNARFPQQALPAIVVLLDNFAALQENFEALIETGLIPLARRSLGVGISLVLATNLHVHLPGRLYSLFGERVTFKQANTDSYLDIVGRGAAEIGDLPGRGYIRKDRRPLAFQTALPVGLLNADGQPVLPEAEELRALGAQMRAAATERGQRSIPEPVRVLAEHVSLTSVLQTPEAAALSDGQIILGQGGNLHPAVIDLRRAGPHFMINGPPLSGKTTALYTAVFTLAHRSDPEHAAFVLVDMQRRFVEYGGARSLSDLPHTIAYITEVEELEGLVAQLRAECALLADHPERDLFIIIDNFDDFSEEIENQRALGSELALLARRYGRDGLHIIAAGTPEGGSSDLKRRIMASNYGIGLRTTAAVEALRVMRTPTALRNKELAVGRGFVVKSGQTALIQIASPYDDQLLASTNGESDDEQRIRALDGWVTTIAARFQTRAAWSVSPDAEPPTSRPTSAEQRKVERIMALVRVGMQQEVAHLKENNGTTPLLTEQFVALETGQWASADALRGLLKDLYRKDQQAQGMSEEMTKMMADMLDDESLLMALEGANNG